MKRARLMRYARCQFKDYALERGVMVLIIALFNLAGPVMMIRATPPAQRILNPASAIGAEVVVVFATLILLAVLFSSQELIGRQRKLGYYRLTFAKPVNPVLFYAQVFAVHLLGTVVLVSGVAALFSLIAVPVPIGRIAALAAIAFVLFGGVGFLVSAFFNHDSVVVIVVFGLSFVAKLFASSHTGFAARFADILIPVDHLSALKPLILAGTVAGKDVAWVLGYGLIGFILGLLAVRYTQLAD